MRHCVVLSDRRTARPKAGELEREVGQLTMEVDLLKKGARLGRARNDANYSIVSVPVPSPSRKDAA